MEYKLIESGEHVDFVASVMDHISNGWILQGGASVCVVFNPFINGFETLYTQAVIKNN